MVTAVWDGSTTFIQQTCMNCSSQLVVLMPSSALCLWPVKVTEDGVAQLVEHWTANLATWVRSPVGEEPSDLMCAILNVQMESNWAGKSVCNCRHTGNWCDYKGRLKYGPHKTDTNTHADTTIPSRRMRSGGWRDEWQGPLPPPTCKSLLWCVDWYADWNVSVLNCARSSPLTWKVKDIFRHLDALIEVLCFLVGSWGVYIVSTY